MTRLACLLILCCGSAALAEDDDAGTPTAAQIEFFEKKVRPVLAENCFQCHGAKEQKGSLRLDSRGALLKGGDTGPAIAPGHPDESELIAAVGYDPNGYQMPPGGKLADDQIAALTEWVRMGAPWPDTPAADDGPDGGKFDLEERARHWSFQPVRRPMPPDVRQADWPRSPIDRFVLARLEAAGLSPAPEADRRTLLRRVTYDLTGLPPTHEEIAEFLSDDSPDAWERVVDRLLASPHYGERWGRHWLDLVRFAQTAGHEFDFEILGASPYRDYVIRAFNDDLPYDQFVIEHVAGDLLERPRRNADGTNESIVGTAFYWFSQGKHSPVDIRGEECDRIENQLDVLGKTFLGLTVACARCHDHKFDPITARDYYALSGYMQSIRPQQAFLDPPQPVQSIVRQLDDIKSQIVRRTIEASRPSLAKLADEGPRLLQKAADDSQDPFHAWAVLMRQTNPAEFAKQRTALARRFRDQAEAAVNLPPSTDVFEDFAADDIVPDDSNAAAGRRLSPPLQVGAGGGNAESGGAAHPPLPPLIKGGRKESNQGGRKAALGGWFVTGQAFFRPTRGGDLLLGETAGQPLGEFLRPGLAHSGLVSGRLQGVIRSQTFTIEKRYIHYRMFRHGGKPNPGRQNKNGQVHLVVDGFQFIRNPLYGFLTINLPQKDDFQWHRQDVSRFIGHKAHIEFEDEDDGWMVIDRVLFSDEGTPPEPPNRLVLNLLEDETASAESLGRRFGRLLAETADLWASGGLDQADDAADRVELLNWMRRHGLFDVEQQPAGAEVAPLLEEFRRLEATLPKPTRALAADEGNGVNEFLLVRGNHRRPGPAIERRFLEVFGGAGHSGPGDGSGRLELAWQMVDPTNPLVARVMVNRIWQHHFGRGLVPTPDDFGRMGQPPSHPELLDWLAAEFAEGRESRVESQGPEVRSQRSEGRGQETGGRRQEAGDGGVLTTHHSPLTTHSSLLTPHHTPATDHGPRATDNRWSIKRMHRLMLLSSAYRMQSRSDDPRAAEVDPQNVLLHRMPVRRLEGEIVRDAVLAVSGRLDRRMFGPGVLPHLTPFMEGRGRPQSGPLDGDGRRSVYVSVRRNFLSPLFLAFDFPTPFTTMGRRSVSNVPAQALTMMNNPFVLQQAEVWSRRLLADPLTEPLREAERLRTEQTGRPPQAAERRTLLHRLRVERLYETAFGRLPQQEELTAAMEFIEQQAEEYNGPGDPRAWADLCHVLMNVKEFVFVN